jgi:hypothetical protein
MAGLAVSGVQSTRTSVSAAGPAVRQRGHPLGGRVGALPVRTPVTAPRRPAPHGHAAADAPKPTMVQFEPAISRNGVRVHSRRLGRPPRGPRR